MRFVPFRPRGRSAVVDPAWALAFGAALLFAGLAGQALAQTPCGPTTTVAPGETFFSIAQRCDTTVAAIETANPGVDPHDLQVGQTLNLDVEERERAEVRPLLPDAEPAPAVGHRIELGDTLATIAATLGITIEALIEAHPGLDPDRLPVGEIILPPGPPTNDEAVQVAGILTEEGVECPAMRGDDGRLYTLLGDLEGHGPGDPVVVRGTLPDVSPCMQGITLEIEDIRTAG